MPSSPRSKLRPLFTGLVITSFLVTAYLVHFQKTGMPSRRPGSSSSEPTNSASSPSNAIEGPEAARDWILSHNLSFPLHYGSREIIVRSKPGLARASITKIKSASSRGFFEDEHGAASAAELTSRRPVSPKSITLEVPSPRQGNGPVHASSLMFGIQTTISRLEDSLEHLSRWIAYSGARLFVILIEKEGVPVDLQRMGDLQVRMRSQGFDVSLVSARQTLNFPQRYFSLVHLMYSNRAPETKWISLIDDDTFFPSMPLLLEMLKKHNPEEEQYLGALSEDWWAVSTYGFMAFGGGGMFLSITLAAMIDPYAEECLQDLGSSAGDITTMECIYAHSNTKLTPIRALNQVDMQGDLSGFYESGRNQISLHHWKEGSVFGTGLPMPAMHLVADVCGECFLQRWQFDDEWILTNGYSIARYPNEHLLHANMDRMEHTWNQNMDIRHSLGPTRPRLALESDKIQYLFLDAIASDKGIRQLYLHRGVDGEQDSIFELLWRKADDT